MQCCTRRQSQPARLWQVTIVRPQLKRSQGLRLYSCEQSTCLVSQHKLLQRQFCKAGVNMPSSAMNGPYSFSSVTVPDHLCMASTKRNGVVPWYAKSILSEVAALQQQATVSNCDQPACSGAIDCELQSRHSMMSLDVLHFLLPCTAQQNSFWTPSSLDPCIRGRSRCEPGLSS